MNESFTKVDLVKELALSARISRRRVELVLETLTQIAYRRARGGFAVPGICKLDVVHRKARQVRNPQTNEILFIAEHDALRVRPVKRAKNAVAPTPRALVQVVASPPAEPVTETVAVAATPIKVAPAPAAPTDAAPAPAAPASAAPPAPHKVATPPPSTAPAPATVDDGVFISFRCKSCGQEIEAPIEMVGGTNECPTCGENLIVPYTSEEGTIWYQNRQNAPEKLPPNPGAIAAMKGRTIRIELPDDI